MPRVAAVQMTSTDNLENNLARMETSIAEASQRGAEIIAFPEMAYFMGPPEAWRRELDRFESLMTHFSEWARRFRIHLIPGSVREPLPNDSHRFWNSLFLFDPQGKKRAQYRKLFLFKAQLPDRIYEESRYCEAGTDLTVCALGGNLGTIGLSICFDLRFPEVFRSLKKRGANLVFLPSAFTVPTGLAHWEVLTRARAIENQFFFVAPGQVGKTGDGSQTYGHSAIVSPWGDVLGSLDDKPGLLFQDLDYAQIEACRSRVDAWGCRREALFPIR